MPADLQTLCAQGQEQLMRTEYLEAERTLEEAEQLAWTNKDFDTLARVYMPLQEARRQRRQKCGEGIVHLNLLATNEHDQISGRHVVENYPDGQLLVAGWGTIEAAIEVRKLQREHMLYVETFLAAVYPAGNSRVVAIVPTEDVRLPSPSTITSIDDLVRKLPPHSIVLSENDLPREPQKGTTQTFAKVMALWERLHAPFLAAADMQIDPLRKIEAYRKTIRVDYACELAHQRASQAARELMRTKRSV